MPRPPASVPAAAIRVLLVSMPFGALERPSLGLALLGPEVQAVGAAVDTEYLGFALADRIGVPTYQWLVHDLPYEAFAGEWLFTAALHGEDAERDRRYLDDHLGGHWRLPAEDRRRLAHLRPAATAFLDEVLDGIPWDRYDLVGFTSTFQQNLPSLALAQRVKQRHPQVLTVFGGANWEGEMGTALHETYPFVDCCCSGEADRALPALVAALAAGEPLDEVAGTTHRRHGASVTTAPGPPIEDLDALPLPDLAPWFRALLDSTAAEQVAPTLLVETARGCWWGAHSHCTFCGLNGATMAFRSKSPPRVLHEVRTLAERWSVETFGVVDNILDMRYFRSVLQDLADDDRRFSFFWEVKANLSHDQVRLLADAGVDHVQPGIESLSDDVLARMGKGTTVLRNLAMLKHCREHGVVPEWNLLYGVPGEDPEDYAAMARLVGAITHLTPPSGHGQIRLDRFSPYHQDPAAHGLLDVRPAPPLDLLYPVDAPTLARISYYFTFDYADGRRPLDYARPVLDAIDAWRRAHATSALWVVPDDGDPAALTILDQRGRHRRSARLDGWKAAVYEACDRSRSRAELAQLPELDAVGDPELDRFLDRCVATGLMATDGTAHLALAVHHPARPAKAAPRLRRLPVAAAP